jgi:hypothetical protein
MHIEKNLIHAREIKELLTGITAVYDPERNLSTVRFMASPLHDSVFSYANVFREGILGTGLISMNNRQRVLLSPRSYLLSGRVNDIPSLEEVSRH